MIDQGFLTLAIDQKGINSEFSVIFISHILLLILFLATLIRSNMCEVLLIIYTFLKVIHEISNTTKKYNSSINIG